ncbi:MAG: ATP-binding protein, partial [Prochlorococcaceae cyanobacterium]
RSVKTDHVRLDLAAVVKSALLSLRPLLQSSAAELTSSDLDHPLPLIGDAEQLRIACGNLLSNGLEALQMVPPSQRRLLVKLESRDGQATLTVADSGSGLPQEQIEQMILASTKSDGMGLGLFIAQAIARNHGGDLLAYRSLELGGAELRLTLDVNGRDPDRHRATRTYKSNQ